MEKNSNKTTKDKNQAIQVKKTGHVVSDKSDKTVIVEVVTLKTHPVYFKKYRVSKKYKVHDEKNEFKVGDQVEIVQCRPISKEKSWKVLGLVK